MNFLPNKIALIGSGDSDLTSLVAIFQPITCRVGEVKQGKAGYQTKYHWGWLEQNPDGETLEPSVNHTPQSSSIQGANECLYTSNRQLLVEGCSWEGFNSLSLLAYHTGGKEDSSSKRRHLGKEMQVLSTGSQAECPEVVSVRDVWDTNSNCCGLLFNSFTATSAYIS